MAEQENIWNRGRKLGRSVRFYRERVLTAFDSLAPIIDLNQTVDGLLSRYVI